MACKYYINGLTLSKDEFLNYVKKQPLEESAKILNLPSTPTAPFVMDTNAWTKLGLKVALKEAVAQGVDKIAWTTGTQQFDRWGTEKIDWAKTPKENYEIRKDSLSGEWVVTIDAMGPGGKNKASLKVGFPTKQEAEDYANKGSFQVTIQEQFRGTALEGMNVDETALSEKGILVETKEDLKAAIDRTLSREKNEAERQKLTDRIWDRMQKEDSGTSLPRKEGMESFYGAEGTKGIVGGVAEKVFGQKVGETKILSTSAKLDRTFMVENRPNEPMGRTWLVVDEDGNVRGRHKTETDAENDAQRLYDGLYEIKKRAYKKQPSIDITPKLKAQVEKGLPKFAKDADVYRGVAIALANGQNIVAALESPAPTTFAHEAIFHSTIEPYLESNQEAKQAFIDEYNEVFGENESDWSTDVSEYTARVYEKYLSNGRKLKESDVKDKRRRDILQKAFDAFTEMMRNLYQSVISYKGKEIQLSDQARRFFDKVLGLGTEVSVETRVESTMPKVQKNIFDLITNKKSSADITPEEIFDIFQYAKKAGIYLGENSKLTKKCK